MHEISCTKYHAIGRIFFKRNLVNVIYQQSCNLFRRYFLKFCSVTYKNKTQVGQQIAISSYSHILMDIEEQVILAGRDTTHKVAIHYNET